MARGSGSAYWVKRIIRLAEQEGGALRHPVVLMHNQRGTEYAADLMDEVRASLRRSLHVALAAGVPRERVLLDPGIGFGKTAAHGVEVLRRFAELTELGQPLLVGASRK